MIHNARSDSELPDDLIINISHHQIALRPLKSAAGEEKLELGTVQLTKKSGASLKPLRQL